MKKSGFLFLLFFGCLVNKIFAAAPVINSITPDTGYNTTSTKITINGANFSQNSKVYVGHGGAYIKGSVDTPDSACGVYVLDNYAYVADGFSGLQVIDISNPTTPGVIGSVNTPDDAEGVYVIGDCAYVADYALGLQVIHKLSAGTICETNFVDNNTLTGNIPAGLIHGPYNIKVVNSSNESGILHNCFTVLSQAPTVILSADTTNGIAPLTINFTTVAVDTDGSIAKYEWDFNGDGNYETTTILGSISYIYDMACNCSAKVKVTDNSGATAEDCVEIAVSRPQNSLPLGNVDVNSPGSANRVDGHDLYVLSRSFGSQPGDSNWNNIVNGDDLVILAGNFGKRN